LDQSISTNMYYDISKFEDNKVPASLLIREESMAYRYGIKTLYYLNSNDNSGEVSQEQAQADDSENENDTQIIDYEDDGCAGGACSV
ncbi:MAG: ribonucleotide-diphosphate reductase subunit alpha, partial [Bacteroidia bacterium]